MVRINHLKEFFYIGNINLGYLEEIALLTLCFETWYRQRSRKLFRSTGIHHYVFESMNYKDCKSIF